MLENSNSQLGGSEAGRSAYKRAGRQIEIDTLYDTTMAKLLVIGHSFVRRLKEYLGGKGLRLERQFSSTVIRGFGGMRLASLRQHLVYVNRQKPTVIVVDIGTNDLASPMCCPLHLANEVVSVARQFAAVPSVQHVVVVDVMRRVATGVRMEVRADFNDARTAYNAALHRLTDGLANIHAWKHRGMSEEWQSLIRKKNTHELFHIASQR